LPTNNNNIDALLEGVKWRDYGSDNPISFGFPETIGDYEADYHDLSSYASGFQSLNGQQRQVIHNWIAMVGEVSTAHFRKLSERGEVKGASLRFALSNAPKTASAFLPGKKVNSGDAGSTQATSSRRRSETMPTLTLATNLGTPSV